MEVMTAARQKTNAGLAKAIVTLMMIASLHPFADRRTATVGRWGKMSIGT